jgi:hypothetical protein
LQLAKAPPVPRLDIDHLGQLIDRLLQIHGARRRDFQGVGRVVGGQHHAIAIQDQSPVGHDGHDGRAVAFGLLVQIVMAHDLQIDQTGGDKTEGHKHHGGEHQHP